jgi:hypothetical protein
MERLGDGKTENGKWKTRFGIGYMFKALAAKPVASSQLPVANLK